MEGGWDMNQLDDHGMFRTRSTREEGLHRRDGHVGNEKSSYLDQLGKDTSARKEGEVPLRAS